MITTKSNVKIIRPGDDAFTFDDGIVVYRRGALEITEACPDHYKSVIHDAYQKGYLKPLVVMTEREYMLMGLTNE